MTVDFKAILNKIALGEHLSREESRQSFEFMMSGDASGPQIGAFLMGLRVRGETVEEITGAAEVMRAKARTIQAPAGAVDTCGTGGDGASTYNISTAAAIILAACDVPVAKHGNRAMSSKSGSADVLESLGINIEAEPDTVRACMQKLGIGFLMATRHHSAMRHVGPARAMLGMRTIFNLLGPLANPAGAKRQVIGVFDRNWLRPLAEVLARLGSEHVWVVHGADGLDELSISGPSHVVEYKDGSFNEFQVIPEKAALTTHKIDSIRGGDAAYNAAALRRLLDGEKTAYRDIVLLNAAAALIVAGRVDSLEQGARQAAEAIDTGGARHKLEQWVRMSNE